MRPLGKALRCGKKPVIVQNIHRQTKQGLPALRLFQDTPFRRRRHHKALRLEAFDGALDFTAKTPAILGCIQCHIIDRDAIIAQGLRKMAHGRQDQNNFLFVMFDRGAFPHDLHHQDVILRAVDVFESDHIIRKLIAQYHA